MSAEIVEKLIGEVFSSAPQFVSFVFQGGEPLLAGLPFYLNFIESVSKQNKKNVPVFYSIQTNGTLITEEFSHFFHKNDWLVGISLDGQAGVNDRARFFENGKGAFQATMKGIARLKQASVRFNILSVVTSANYMNAKETYSFFKKEGFEFLQFVPCLDFIDGTNSWKLQPAQWLHFQSVLFDLWYEDILHGNYVSIRWFDNLINLLNGHRPDSCASEGICGGYFVCESNGDIYPCDFYCLDDYKLGNIGQNKWSEISTQTTYHRFISDSLSIHEKCSSCQYYRLCRGGCRKEREKDLLSHSFCEVYKAFFDYAIKRLLVVAECAQNKGLTKPQD